MNCRHQKAAIFEPPWPPLSECKLSVDAAFCFALQMRVFKRIATFRNFITCLCSLVLGEPRTFMHSCTWIAVFVVLVLISSCLGHLQNVQTVACDLCDACERDCLRKLCHAKNACACILQTFTCKFVIKIQIMKAEFIWNADGRCALHAAQPHHWDRLQLGVDSSSCFGGSCTWVYTLEEQHTVINSTRPQTKTANG